MTIAARLAVITLGVASVTGCDALDPEPCPAVLQWNVLPESATLAVGDTLTVRAEALGCGGTQRLEEVMRWNSRDTSVARVSRETGLVTALGPGDVLVVGEDLGPFGIGPVQIPITVTP